MHKLLQHIGLATLMSLFFSITAIAQQRYTILNMNTQEVTIGGKKLKRGSTFSLTSCDAIKWSSSEQWIKVRDENTKQTHVFTKSNICDDGKPRQHWYQRLDNCLVKKRILATRSFDDPVARQHADSLVQLVDTITFTIDRQPQKDFLYIATYAAGNFKQRTKLPMSPDGTCIYLTRAIYGHYAKPTTSYITILRYNLQTNAAPDSLGYLYVQPLPLDLEAQKYN